MRVQTSTAGRAAVRKGAANGAGPLRPEGCMKWEGCGTNGLQHDCGKNCVLPGVCGCSC
ncbi:hypothetical protein FOC1_g10004634 [Fusarium oxysporum f. sp. cubense race 1]|uniref:Uncharacterized protein n=1 Tax=Fusarium oxysporum f. sp. cubense (strain race 1) TaxID=1229664 RepID=N4U6H7_FUSC1|nr:hypothetical protein FOC1_g10004634 [Fusarium oxysporum f. sp. cubense race 1]